MVKKLVFVGTGGTIAGRAASALDAVGYTAAQVGVEQLLDDVPGLRGRMGDVQLQSEQLMQVDSKDISWRNWCDLASRVRELLITKDVQAVVITHGTDTVEETAFFLSRVLPSALLVSKPVVLTCAMRPSTSFSPDGPQNMSDAVSVALSLGACGVLVVCAGSVHSARDVQKVRPYRLDAFDSGDAGPLGYVEEGVVRWVGMSNLSIPHAVNFDETKLLAGKAPRVELLVSCAATSGAIVRALCAPPAQGDEPVQGIVLAATGNGTVHCELEAALLQAQIHGIRVVRGSRCGYGQVVSTGAATGAFEHSHGLSPVKARIALMLELLA